MADILLVEPDAILAGIYKRAFELSGHTVRLSVSAQESVFHVDERNPDIIVTELQLVAHSGIEFLYELRSYSDWQNIPVLIHSCIPPTEFEQSSALLKDMLGVSGYLYKPHTTLQKLLREVADITAAPALATADAAVADTFAVRVTDAAPELLPRLEPKLS